MIKLSTLKSKEVCTREMGASDQDFFYFELTNALQNLNLYYEAIN